MFTPNQVVFVPNWNGTHYVVTEAKIEAIHVTNSSTVSEMGEAKSTQSNIQLAELGYRGESDVYLETALAQMRVDALNAEYLEAFEKQYVEMGKDLEALRQVVNV